MGNFLLLLGIITSIGTEVAGEPSTLHWTVESAPLTRPIIRYPVLEASTPGRVESVVGDVTVHSDSGWLPVRVGDTLSDGALVQISAEASLSIRFSGYERINFMPASEIKWFKLSVRGRGQ